MADYNQNQLYNSGNSIGGLLYNSSSYTKILNIRESLSAIESNPSIQSNIYILEKGRIQEIFSLYVLSKINQGIKFSEENKHFAIISISDQTSAKDLIDDLFVLAKISENYKLEEEINNVSVIASFLEEFKSSDQINIDVLIDILQRFDLTELYKLAVETKLFESAYMVDFSPRSAISDFLIGKVDELDQAYDWIIPFEMKVDWRNTTLQVMPQTESEYIDIPGVDGSLIENTTYKNRIFNIVAYSQEGLTITEKEDLKSEIARILDSTKNKSKKFTIQNADISFDVKYSGSAEIAEGPSFVKATIPFETSPYAYPLFDTEIYGSGLMVNNGDSNSGFVNIISSGCVNPSFRIGTIDYSWEGTVPEGYKLYIDHNNYTCYLENNLGDRINAISKLTGEFQVVPANSSVAITASENTTEYLYTVLKEKLLWKR